MLAELDDKRLCGVCEFDVLLVNVGRSGGQSLCSGWKFDVLLANVSYNILIS